MNCPCLYYNNGSTEYAECPNPSNIYYNFNVVTDNFNYNNMLTHPQISHDAKRAENNDNIVTLNPKVNPFTFKKCMNVLAQPFIPSNM